MDTYMLPPCEVSTSMVYLETYGILQYISLLLKECYEEARGEETWILKLVKELWKSMESDKTLCEIIVRRRRGCLGENDALYHHLCPID